MQMISLEARTVQHSGPSWSRGPPEASPSDLSLLLKSAVARINEPWSGNSFVVKGSYRSVGSCSIGESR